MGGEVWCLEEEDNHEKMLGAASAADHRDQVDEAEDGAPGNWDSDSSSDLFDLDLEYIDCST